jgi:hypothetical protein
MKNSLLLLTMVGFIASQVVLFFWTTGEESPADLVERAMGAPEGCFLSRNEFPEVGMVEIMTTFQEREYYFLYEKPEKELAVAISATFKSIADDWDNIVTIDEGADGSIEHGKGQSLLMKDLQGEYDLALVALKRAVEECSPPRPLPRAG